MYTQEIAKTINCPQCGDRLEIYFRWTKLIACNSCKSSIFLEDNGTLTIGESSMLSPEPSLLKLYEPFSIEKRYYFPIGKLRYSYGRGFWEEWFLKDDKNQEFWLSIDEGDFVLQQKISMKLPFSNPLFAKVGKKYGEYFVSERGTGTLVGFEGELPENVTMGASHFYLHLSLDRGKLVTVEVTGKKYETFLGKWIDPLRIKRHDR